MASPVPEATAGVSVPLMQGPTSHGEASETVMAVVFNSHNDESTRHEVKQTAEASDRHAERADGVAEAILAHVDESMPTKSDGDIESRGDGHGVASGSTTNGAGQARNDTPGMRGGILWPPCQPQA